MKNSHLIALLGVIQFSLCVFDFYSNEAAMFGFIIGCVYFFYFNKDGN